MTTEQKVKPSREPTQDELREYFKYVDGHLIRIKNSPKGPNLLGKRLGYTSGHGHLQGGFKNRYHLLHRLVWIYHNGAIESEVIDHINRVKTDNRIENLRAATHQQNSFNSAGWSNAASEFKGVSKSKKKWMARIRSDGKQHYLGTFRTEIEASLSYRKFANILHGDFSIDAH